MRGEADLSERDPTAKLLPSTNDHHSPTAWTEARSRLADAESYWLTTVRPDGRPHVAPLLAVWHEGALHFVANRSTRKARNLIHDRRVVMAAATADSHLVVEGLAARVTDEAQLKRLAALYVAKYQWSTDVRDSALWGDGAPTSGGPPYDVYKLTPTTVFGFGTDETFSPTRWTFSKTSERRATGRSR